MGNIRFSCHATRPARRARSFAHRASCNDSFPGPRAYSPGPIARRQSGFTLLEVLVSMVVLAVGVLAVSAAFRWAEDGLLYGVQSLRALAMAESRIESKRALPWGALLTDDMDGDGYADVTMRDDGAQDDSQAGDGTYSAGLDDGSIHLVWTVHPDRPGSLWDAGAALIVARATYTSRHGQERHIEIATVRANPRYLGYR